MKNKLASWLEKYDILLVFLLSVGFQYWHWPELFSNMQSMFFSFSGDGIKNFYTYSYHCLHGDGLWFEGMNYPYGEHIMYTDAFPLLSIIISKINGTLVDFDVVDVLMIYNLALFAAMIFSTVFIYLVFRSYKVSMGFALFAAFAITFLQPQFDRVTSHFTLSMAYLIPMVWYLMLKIEQHRSKVVMIVLALLLLVQYFIHPYLGVIAAAFMLATYLVKGLFQRNNFVKAIYLPMLALLPLIIFQVFFRLTDPYLVGRQTTPWGFFHYQADFNSVFLPSKGFMKDFLNNFFLFSHGQWEGRGYPGFFTVVGLIMILFFWLQRRFRGHQNLLSFKNHIWHYFFGASLLLLFACGIPFSWNLEFLLDSVPFIKQFRSIGRFTWPFFYASVVLVILFYYRIYRLMHIRGLGTVAKIGSFFILLFYFGEGKTFHLDRENRFNKQQDGFKHFMGSKTNYKVYDWLLDNNYQLDSFQAILSLPFVNIGSEEFHYRKSSSKMHYAFALSLKSGLPLMGTESSRTNVNIARNQQKIISSNPEPNALVDLLNPKQPILLFVDKRHKNKLTIQEQYYCKKAKEMGKVGDILLYELAPKYLDSFPREYYAPLLDSNHTIYELISLNGKSFYSNNSNFVCVVESYEQTTHYDSTFAGYYKEGREERSELFTYEGNIPSGNYDLEFWCKLNLEKPFFGSIRILIYDKKGEFIKEFHESLRNQTEFHGNWVQSHINLKLKEEISKLEIVNGENLLHFDELFLKEKSKDKKAWYYISDSMVNYDGNVVHLKHF